MNIIKIEATESTPKVVLESNCFSMIGVCASKNPNVFFAGFQQQLYEALNSKVVSVLIFELTYFNSATSGCLVDLFKKISEVNVKNEVIVYWKHESDDEEIKESGELFSGITGIKFNYIAKD